MARRPVSLGFVYLDGDKRPKKDKPYSVVPPSSELLEDLPYPEETDYRRLNLDLYNLYIDDLPDFTNKNEVLLKVQINTRNPQALENSPVSATFTTDFEVRDQAYAPTFLYRGAFRNVLFQEWINLRFDLYELDTDAEVYYARIKGVINSVPEIKNLNILNGIPYLNLATQLFESIIKTFGKNPDDHVWGETPILELVPTLGGAFLRSGIYILFEKENSEGIPVSFDEIAYENEKLVVKNRSRPTPSNHLIFGISLRKHTIR